jgi:CubicO group peptidase (beta-lactamase class C family)
MRRIIIIFGILQFFISPLSFAQQDSIDLFIHEQMKQQKIVGLSLGIVKNKKIIKSAGYGKANVEWNVDVTDQTIFKIASLSKQFIAAGILKLVEQGKVDLNSPINKFFRNAPYSWKAITVKHLLNHTSGLPVDPPGFDGMKHVSDSIYIRRAYKDTLAFPPGMAYQYSNFGYYVLADIIRIVSGISFSKFMEKQIFAPCNLTNTTITSTESIIMRRAAGYIYDSANHLQNAPDYIAMRPSGAFLSNIHDLLKWEMLMQKATFLTNRQWSQMWNDKFKTTFTMDNEPIYYGYGWMINKYGQKQLIHHGGSLPGFKSVYFRFPEEGTAIIILTNSDQVDAYSISFGLVDILSK